MAHRFGSWQLDELIAVGGIGEVWRASRGADDLAAIKRLHSHLLRNDLARAQFAIEQQLATTLPRHPNLIHASEAGDSDGQPYVALDLIPGRDLRHLAASGPAVPQSRAIAIVAAACDAVAHLHAHGWVHGDINPGNVMVDHFDSVSGQEAPGTLTPGNAPEQQMRGEVAPNRSDRVVVVDLGVARRIGEAGTVRGTHAYMAPEQIRGEAWTPATDVFALGVVLWELVAGTRLFHRGPPWLSMAAVMETEPAPLPDLWLDAIVRAALAKHPGARTQSAAAFAAALRGV